MQIYIFKSQNDDLRAFASDPEGSRLPSRFAPWQPDGVIKSGTAPPHSFSRYRIETAIKLTGYQLWRLKKQAAQDALSATR